MGVSFSGRRGWAQGTLVTLAIGLHNVPEGLAVATVMAARGATPQKAFLWTVLSSMPQALVAVPSYLFVEAFTALLPVALGFAAGCMLWIVFAELMPEALEQVRAWGCAHELLCCLCWPCCCAACAACDHHANDRGPCSVHMHDAVHIAVHAVRPLRVSPVPARDMHAAHSPC